MKPDAEPLTPASGDDTITPVRATLRELVGSSAALKRVGASWWAINVAEWAYVTALSIHGYRTYGPLAVGLIGARFAPGALFGSALAANVIRRRPTLTLRMLAVGRAALVTAVGLAVLIGAPLGIIVGFVWIDAIVAAPYRPVQSSILPALAGTPKELSTVAGNVPVSKALGQATGALAGSLPLFVTSPDVIVGVAAVTFLLSSIIVAPIHPDASTPVLAAQSADLAADRRGRWGMIGTGFSLIVQRARPLLILGGARSLTRGLWTALTVYASIRLLGLGNAGVGTLMAAAGIGAAVAMPIALQFAGRARLAGPAALTFALAGLPIVLVALLASPVPAVLLVAIWGAAFALADSISNALIHRVVEFRLLAPSVAAIESAKLLVEGLGALAAPALLALVGVRDALIVAGAPLPLLVALSRPGLLAVDRRAEARVRPLAVLRATPSFRGLTMLSLESVAARLTHTTAAAGVAILHQGDLGDSFYLIDTGRVEVSVDGYRVAILGPGASFGEKALLRATPRSATVTALEPCALWSLDGADFVAAATGSEGPVAHRVRRAAGESLEEVLAGIPLFGAFDRRALAAMGEATSTRAGVQVVRQGEPGDRFYVLLEGEAQVTIDERPGQVLHAGDWFGEIALLYSVPRTATVTASTELKLWALGRKAFLIALGNASPVGPAPDDGAPAGAGLLV